MKAKIGKKTLELSLNVGRVLHGKSNKQDIGDLEEGPVSLMFTDPTLLAETVWANYDDRLEEIGFETQSAFFESLDGATMREIEKGMKEAIRDFFPWGNTVLDQLEADLARMAETMQAFAQSGPPSGATLES